MFKKVISILVIAMITVKGYSNNNTSPETNDSNLNRRVTNAETQLPEFRAFDYTVESFLKRWGIAGASMALVKDGKLVYTRGYGYADEEIKDPVQPEHLFRVASVSKLITAVAVMKLVEAGNISLDAPVFGHNGILNHPNFLKFRDKRIADITVRHLMEHSGGWTTRYGDPMFMPAYIAQKMDTVLPVNANIIIRYVLDRYLNFTPGTRSSYSNFGFMVLGEVISKASGMPYENYVKEAILYPLGIFNMQIGHNLYEEKAAEEVKYYDKEGATYRISCDGSGKFVPRPYGGTDVHLLGAAGGWIASAAQLTKLMVAIDGLPEKPDILTEESIRIMTENSDLLSPMGWRFTFDNGEWWRTGTLAGSSALMLREENGLSWAVVVNTSTYRGSRFPREIKKMMNLAISRIENWPSRDLFNLQFPNSISPIPPEWFTFK
jgi:CubicO group peptidase (beta-lactamase class C family)